LKKKFQNKIYSNQKEYTILKKKCFSLTNFSNDKQTQESLKNDLQKISSHETNKVLVYAQLKKTNHFHYIIIIIKRIKLLYLEFVCFNLVGGLIYVRLRRSTSTNHFHSHLFPKVDQADSWSSCSLLLNVITCSSVFLIPFLGVAANLQWQKDPESSEQWIAEAKQVMFLTHFHLSFPSSSFQRIWMRFVSVIWKKE